MKASLRLLVISGLALYLFSCTGEVASSTPTSNGSEPFSSSLRTPSAPLPYESSDKASSTKKTSLDSSEPGASSSVAVYYTVSIYQSYYIENEGRYGNPRFDTSVVYEAGTLLYSNFDERSDLMEKCCDDYRPIGGDGAYGFHAFFYDKECTRYIGYDCYINSDFRIYYYCDG
jgi:hypothetical protein